MTQLVQRLLTKFNFLTAWRLRRNATLWTTLENVIWADAEFKCSVLASAKYAFIRYGLRWRNS